MEKYKMPLWSAAQRASRIRGAFLNRPSLSNGTGRNALFFLIQTIHELCIPMPYCQMIAVSNVGGDALNWNGNCKVGQIYDSNIGEYSDDQLVEHLQKKKCRKTGHIRVSDIQVSSTSKIN